MPLLQTDIATMFYAERGKGGPALVAVHGAGGTHQHWGLQLRDLSDTARVVVIDLPGHGRSPAPGCNTVADYSQAVVAALDALNLEQVVLAGHSMGGAVALWSALTAPERVAGLVLVATGARLPVLPAIFESVEQGDLATAVRLVIERAYARTTPPRLQAAGEVAFLENSLEVFAGDLRACAAYNVMNELAAITSPALVVCGDDDRITPAKFSHLLHNTIPNAQLVMVPDAGHMVLIEQPDRVNTAIRDFLAA